MRVGLIGNPNVGKSTIFNALTGMHQHTGNWPGKTVDKAYGYRVYNGVQYIIEDLPGTYSLISHSKEEEITRDYVYFGDYDALIVVCDACSIERNLNLVMQVLEVTNKVVVCVNLIDEAKKKKIEIDFNKLSDILGVPVVGTIARSKKGIDNLLDDLSRVIYSHNDVKKINYEVLDNYLVKLFDIIPNYFSKNVVGVHLLLKDYDFLNSYDYKYNTDFSSNSLVKKRVSTILNDMFKDGLDYDDIQTLVMENVSVECEKICSKVVRFNDKNYDKNDRFLDKIFTNKVSGSLIMIGLLFLVLWITIVFANYPSQFLYDLFFKFEKVLFNFLAFFHIPSFIVNALVYGVYRVLAWVVAVMLPPMAIFFPLFTILEDLGYLPRIAFNLDGIYQKCGSCGKQALTMVQGFGCNAVGVTGSRIIDSPRERLLSIVTNSFVPCNGRFPLLISLISMFLVSNKVFGSLILTLFIVFGIFITFLITKILSKTLLKGFSSSFILELPPYRRPQIGKVIVRSIFDRTLFVLKRAVIVSAPAGLIIWLLANIYIGGSSILGICTDFLSPFGSILGMDGVILMAFLLGFPANEIVIPIMIMGYMSLGYIIDINNTQELYNLFLNNGWNIVTSICVMLFSIFHFPCMTTLLTIKKETGSLKWTFLSFIIPLALGIIVCFIVNLIVKI
ncbi:MAG: ferrous iron transport protein B [Bacilli bacterium]|nr:ferrous iron transport protein B [Bacilli bacterium]